MKSITKWTAKDVAFTGMAVAIIMVCKIALQSLPNIETNTFWIMMFTLVLGSKMFVAVFACILLEGCIYGFGIWWVIYLYVWPLLVLITWLIRRRNSVLLYAVVSAAFGLCFGALGSVTYLFIGGPAMMFNWWISGIPFDLIHCVGNFAIMMLLYKPVRRVMDKFITV